jgi:hypothetical protein
MTARPVCRYRRSRLTTPGTARLVPSRRRRQMSNPRAVGRAVQPIVCLQASMAAGAVTANGRRQQRS